MSVLTNVLQRVLLSVLFVPIKLFVYICHVYNLCCITNSIAQKKQNNFKNIIYRVTYVVFGIQNKIKCENKAQNFQGHKIILKINSPSLKSFRVHNNFFFFF